MKYGLTTAEAATRLRHELPHPVTVPILHADYWAAVEWCERNFGKDGLSVVGRADSWIYDDTCRWAVLRGIFHFRDLADATMFKLAVC